MNTQYWIHHYETNTRLNDEMKLPETPHTLPEAVRAPLGDLVFVLASFGLSLAIGAIVDQIVGWWWDAEGQLARKLAEELHSLESSLLEGEGGLLPELQKLRKTRSQVRGEAFRLLLSESVR